VNGAKATAETGDESTKKIILQNAKKTADAVGVILQATKAVITNPQVREAHKLIFMSFEKNRMQLPKGSSKKWQLH
jgi:hypothetical protein